MRGVGTSSERLGCEVGAGGDLDLGFSGGEEGEEEMEGVSEWSVLVVSPDGADPTPVDPPITFGRLEGCWDVAGCTAKLRKGGHL